MSMATESVLEIALLGRFEARVDGREVPATVWRQRRAAVVVKLLALEPDHPEAIRLRALAARSELIKAIFTSQYLKLPINGLPARTLAG